MLIGALFSLSKSDPMMMWVIIKLPDRSKEKWNVCLHSDLFLCTISQSLNNILPPFLMHILHPLFILISSFLTSTSQQQQKRWIFDDRRARCGSVQGNLRCLQCTTTFPRCQHTTTVRRSRSSRYQSSTKSRCHRVATTKSWNGAF